MFAILTIVITGLGLFGLASFTAEQRTKEIGIRKVMGASVPSLVGLMSKDFSVLVIIAFVVSSPLAWWGLTSYLERYHPHDNRMVGISGYRTYCIVVCVADCKHTSTTSSAR